MNVRFILIALLVVSFLLPALVMAAKCTRVLPEEVFAFFGQTPGEVDCNDYEYKMMDLNEDGRLEIAITNYRRSCEDAGYCNFELFEKIEGHWKHIATVPGRIKMLANTTNGYHDLATWLLGHRYVYVWDGHTYRESMQLETSRDQSPTPTPAPPLNATPSPTP